MIKTALVAVSGIFIGALTVEILNRAKPGLTQGLEEKAQKVANTFVSGFKEGWGGEEKETTEPQVQPEQGTA